MVISINSTEASLNFTYDYMASKCDSVRCFEILVRQYHIIFETETIWDFLYDCNEILRLCTSLERLVARFGNMHVKCRRMRAQILTESPYIYSSWKLIVIFLRILYTNYNLLAVD